MFSSSSSSTALQHHYNDEDDSSLMIGILVFLAAIGGLCVMCILVPVMLTTRNPRHNMSQVVPMSLV